MGLVSEQYTPIPMAANASVNNLEASGIGGFLCITAGTIVIVDGAQTIVNTLAMEAGVYYPMPFACSGAIDVTLAGGASGTLGISG